LLWSLNSSSAPPSNDRFMLETVMIFNSGS
jgi:hypothetical protein